MVNEYAGQEFSRVPTLQDLLNVCRFLNEAGALYVVIGGFAMIHYGLNRTTEDIDLLVDDSPENVERIKAALSLLPDGAVKQVNVTDIREYTVVRVADEFLVDLMGSACGITFSEVQDQIEYETVSGVRIPFLKVDALLKTKQSMRERDIEDRRFLQAILKRR